MSRLKKCCTIDPDGSRAIIDAGAFNAVIYVDGLRGIVIKTNEPLRIVPHVTNEIALLPARK